MMQGKKKEFKKTKGKNKPEMWQRENAKHSIHSKAAKTSTLLKLKDLFQHKETAYKSPCPFPSTSPQSPPINPT